MKILLMSDTHGQLEETIEIIKRYPRMDAYIHLGDIGFALSHLDKFWIVKGNHDHDKTLPIRQLLPLENRRVLCMHGNLFDQETIDEVMAMHSIDNENIMDICMNTLYTKLASYAKQKGCDTFFFGHTHHQTDVEVDGVRLINPGSVCFGTPHSGYAVIEIHGSEMTCTFHTSRGIGYD